MSPTQREIVAQRPLKSTELAQIILDDVKDILSTNGMTTGQIAYGRVAYEIRVTLHIDNPAYPTDTTIVRSKGRSGQQKEETPELVAIEPGPLKDTTDEAFLSSTERHRDIQSPNAARVEHSLPITVLRREQDGQTREELVTYSADALEGVPNPNPDPIDIDVSDLAREEWERGK